MSYFISSNKDALQIIMKRNQNLFKITTFITESIYNNNMIKKLQDL